MLHSAWMPRAVDPAAHDRLRFADELDEDRLGALDPALADVVRSVAADLDDELAV